MFKPKLEQCKVALNNKKGKGEKKNNFQSLVGKPTGARTAFGCCMMQLQIVP